MTPPRGRSSRWRRATGVAKVIAVAVPVVLLFMLGYLRKTSGAWLPQEQPTRL